MKSRKKKGFTLVELLATMAIMAILGLAVQQTFDSQTNIYKKRSAQQELQFDVKKIMTIVTKDIQQGRDSTDKRKYIITDSNELTSDDNVVGKMWRGLSLTNYIPILYIEKYDDRECFYAIKNDKTLVKISFSSVRKYKQDLKSYPKLKDVYEKEYEVLQPIEVSEDQKKIIKNNLQSPGQVISHIYYVKGDFYVAYYYDEDINNQYVVKIIEDIDTGRELERDSEGKTLYKEEIISKSVDSIVINPLTNSQVYNVTVNLKDSKNNEKRLSSSIKKIDYGGEKR